MIGLLGDGNEFYVSACTLRDINTTDGILTWAKGAMNYGINN